MRMAPTRAPFQLTAPLRHAHPYGETRRLPPDPHASRRKASLNPERISPEYKSEFGAIRTRTAARQPFAINRITTTTLHATRSSNSLLFAWLDVAPMALVILWLSRKGQLARDCYSSTSSYSQSVPTKPPFARAAVPKPALVQQPLPQSVIARSALLQQPLSQSVIARPAHYRNF